MTCKEFGSRPGYTPQAGAHSEAAAMVRELVSQGRMDRKEGIRLTELALKYNNASQALGIPVGHPEELPDHSKIFPGATNDDGTIAFSSIDK